MKFTCDKCKTQYLISDDKLGSRGVKIRCKRCSNVIILQADGSMSSQSLPESRPTIPEKDSTDKLPSELEEKDDVGEVFDNLFKSGEKRQNGFDDEVHASEVTQLFDPEDLKRLQSQMETTDEESRKIDQVFAEAESTNVTPKAAAQPDKNKKQWYIASEGEQQGPFSYQDLEVFLFKAKIDASTYTWKPGLSDWVVMGDMAELASLFGEKEPGFEREMTEKLIEPAEDKKDWLASSDDSLLSDLVQQELQSAKKTSVETVEKTDYSQDEGPWAEDADLSKDKGFFDSSIEQTTSYSVDGDGLRADGFLDRDLARPAYLSESSKRRRLKRWIFFGSSAVFLLVAAGAVYRFILGGELPFGMLAKAPPSDSHSVIKVVGQSQPTDDQKSLQKKPDAITNEHHKDTPKPSKEEQKPTNSLKDKEKPNQPTDNPPQNTRVAVAGVTKTTQPGEKNSVDRPDPARTSGSKSTIRQKESTKKSYTAKKNVGTSPEDKKSIKPRVESKQESLSKEQIYDVMKKSIPAMKGCVKQQLQRDPSVKGTLLVSFVINPSGNVGSVTTLSKEHAGTYVSECITYIIKEMKFPSFNGDPITIPRVPLTIGN